MTISGGLNEAQTSAGMDSDGRPAKRRKYSGLPLPKANAAAPGAAPMEQHPDQSAPPEAALPWRASAMQTCELHRQLIGSLMKLYKIEYWGLLEELQGLHQQHVEGAADQDNSVTTAGRGRFDINKLPTLRDQLGRSAANHPSRRAYGSHSAANKDVNALNLANSPPSPAAAHAVRAALHKHASLIMASNHHQGPAPSSPAGSPAHLRRRESSPARTLANLKSRESSPARPSTHHNNRESSPARTLTHVRTGKSSPARPSSHLKTGDGSPARTLPKVKTRVDSPARNLPITKTREGSPARNSPHRGGPGTPSKRMQGGESSPARTSSHTAAPSTPSKLMKTSSGVIRGLDLSTVLEPSASRDVFTTTVPESSKEWRHSTLGRRAFHASESEIKLEVKVEGGAADGTAGQKDRGQIAGVGGEGTGAYMMTTKEVKVNREREGECKAPYTGEVDASDAAGRARRTVAEEQPASIPQGLTTARRWDPSAEAPGLIQRDNVNESKGGVVDSQPDRYMGERVSERGAVNLEVVKQEINTDGGLKDHQDRVGGLANGVGKVGGGAECEVQEQQGEAGGQGGLDGEDLETEGTSCPPTTGAGRCGVQPPAGCQAPTLVLESIEALVSGHGDDVRGYGSEDEPALFSDVEEHILEGNSSGTQVFPLLSQWQHKFSAMLEDVVRLEQLAAHVSATEMDSKDALACLLGRSGRYLIKRSTVSLGRCSDHTGLVDVDLSLEGPAGKVSRQQADITCNTEGNFLITNLGRRYMHINDVLILSGESCPLPHLSLIEVGGIRLLFIVNHNATARIVCRTANMSM